MGFQLSPSTLGKPGNIYTITKKMKYGKDPSSLYESAISVLLTDNL